MRTRGRHYEGKKRRDDGNNKATSIEDYLGLCKPKY